LWLAFRDRKGRGEGVLDNWKDNKNVFGPSPGLEHSGFSCSSSALGFLFVMSFSDKAVINGEVSITEYDYLTGISNYIRSLDTLYLTIIWKSIWVSALATVLCLVTAYPIAFGICFASDKWKPLLLLLVVLPFWINLLIRTYALIAVFRSQGYVNLALGTVGLGPYDMLYNNFAVIFGLVYVYMPFMVLPLYATIERLDKSFLGANSISVYSSTFLKSPCRSPCPSPALSLSLSCLGSF
jgi:spermidine/putrescine transport system permease protein